MRTIADDECEHAELAFRILEWALPSLPQDERRRVRNAAKDAFGELSSADIDTSEIERAAGLPSAVERARVVEALERDVMRPLWGALS